MRNAIQPLADSADVDLTLSSGRRSGNCAAGASLHNCGNAVDISAINGIDVGQGTVANPAARDLVTRVQGIAMGMPQVQENFGPLGLFRSFQQGQAQELRGGVFGGVSFFPSAGNYDVWRGHQNHVHIGIW
jgi:hypothetical protein